MKSQVLILLLALGVGASSLFAEEARVTRTFTNKEGTKILADLIDLKGEKVHLVVNRKTFEVPLDTLSAGDQAFIKKWDANRKAAAAEGAEGGGYYSELLYQDDFEKADFDKRWTHFKSKSQVQGGVLVGRTIDIDDHAGVDAIRLEEGRQDLEVAVKFNFADEKAERFNVWFDDKDYKGSHAGHICSVVISPKAITISDAKTGNFENSIYEKRKGGGELDEETQKMLKTKTKNVPIDIKREKWHELVVSTKGDEVSVSINGYGIAKMKSEGFAHGTKSLVSLTTYVDDVHYDDFSIKAAKPGQSGAK